MPEPLNQLSGMPQMSAAFAGWKSKLTFEIVSQSIDDDGWTEEVNIPVSVMGTWQPFTDEDLKQKPEGQRSWSWFMLHVEGINKPFKTNDRVLFNGVLYKVMKIRDYTLNNYVQYDCILDFEN